MYQWWWSTIVSMQILISCEKRMKGIYDIEQRQRTPQIARESLHSEAVQGFSRGSGGAKSHQLLHTEYYRK
jgi:hypothetical protein